MERADGRARARGTGSTAPESPAAAIAGDTVTIKRFAETFGVSVRTVRRWIADKDHPLPCYKPTPKTIFLRWADFEAWLEASRREGRPEAREALERMLQARQ